MYQTNNLSHADAMRAVEAVRKALEERKLEAAVAVADSHGELIAFLRTDGCRLSSIKIAINKAYTAAREQTESGAVGQQARSNNWPLTNYGVLDYTGWGGGLPVSYQGRVVGAVAVSGLTEEEDVMIATIGVQAISGEP